MRTILTGTLFTLILLSAVVLALDADAVLAQQATPEPTGFMAAEDTGSRSQSALSLCSLCRDVGRLLCVPVLPVSEEPQPSAGGGGAAGGVGGERVEGGGGDYGTFRADGVSTVPDSLVSRGV